MSLTNALQSLLVDALLADGNVSGFVDGRVFDDIPERAQYPYCSIGPNYHNREIMECISARKHYFQIDCWTQRQGNRDQVNDLTDAISDAVDGLKGDIGLHALVSCEVVLVRVLDDPDGDKHGIVQVEIFAEKR